MTDASNVPATENVTYHDTRKIFEHDRVTAYTGDLRTLFEIRGAKDAYELFLTAFGTSRPLDKSLIQELQGCLVRNTDERPGEYKRNDYRAGRNAVGALPEDVTEEMQKLLGVLQELGNRDALTAAAYFHAKFENIHPFADGNGRAGRLAISYFLGIIIRLSSSMRKTDRNMTEHWRSGTQLRTCFPSMIF